MLIIGERLNSTRRSVNEAILKKDLAFLFDEAARQLSAGADFIDINCAQSMDKELDDLLWLIDNVKKKFNCGISIDSPDPSTIASVLKIHKDRSFINSITAEEEKLKTLPQLVAANNNVIVLAMDESGMPHDTAARISIVDKVMASANRQGVDKKYIFIDPLVKPVSTEPEQAGYFLETVRRLKEQGVNTVGGLSNVSFGMPKRSLLNAVFIKLAMDAGINGLIIDPTVDLIKTVLDGKALPDEQSAFAQDALLGRDAYAMNYIKAFRSGKLN